MEDRDAGSRFGSRFVLEEKIGAGAMGEVYQARDVHSSRLVAIKVLRRELGEDDDVVARFVRERNVFKKLDHPNIVKIVDLIVEDERIGIAMDLVVGGDLREKIASSRIPPEDAVRIAADLAAGLGAIHAAGVTHRDLKPANVLVVVGDEEAGRIRPKITDFGLSRLTDSSLTQVSTVMGTPLYMAPELANREGASPASDIYSLGVILFEMLTGELPFRGDTTLAVITAHLMEPPPELSNAPDELSDLLDAMLRKNPADRPTANQAEQQLRALVQQGMKSYEPFGMLRAAEQPGGSPTSQFQTKFRPGQDITPHLEVSLVPEAEPPETNRFGILAGVGVLTASALLLGGFLLSRSGENQSSANPSGPAISADGQSADSESPDEEPITVTTDGTSTTGTISTTTTAISTTQLAKTTSSSATTQQPPSSQAPVTQAPTTPTNPVTQAPPQTPAPRPTPAPQPVPPSLGGNEIIGLGGLCLDIPRQNTRNGQDLQMYDCNGTIAQQWTFSGSNIIGMGKCLDIEGPSKQETAKVQIWACEDVPQHRWRTTEAGQIISEYSGLCVDVAFGGTTRGTPVHMWTCNSTPAQKWTLP